MPTLSPWVSNGLSPRVRGNQSASQDGKTARSYWPVRQRSIPACAGEPPTPVQNGVGSNNDRATWVYPRVCGGTLAVDANRNLVGTVYPRVCGGTRTGGARIGSGLSPPKCAGEPSLPLLRLGEPFPGTGVYPRVCGGTPLDTDDRAYRNDPRPCVGTTRNSDWSFDYPRRCCGTTAPAWDHGQATAPVICM